MPDPTYARHYGHAEAVEVTFDPSVLAYRSLLELFFQIHDPTTYEQQGSDVGPSYRSAIFYTTEVQKEVALTTIAEIEASGSWPGPVVSEINPEEPFWEAEPEHQEYLVRYPGGYSCHFVRPTWRLDRSDERPAVILDRKRHCCKVSDEAAFCLIQRPYISKTLLTRRISPRGSP
jgi:peptide-methionine (S)-S-oxide reductase